MKMKTTLIALIATLLITPALAANPNYGKAEDYGSDRFAMINNCMVANITAAAKDKVSVEACMNENGFAFCPNCKVFGNQGPRCLDEDHHHSWCWVKDDER
jgi:hypothetical protein